MKIFTSRLSLPHAPTRNRAKNAKRVLLLLCVAVAIALGLPGNLSAQSITSFSPASGPVGTLVKITGTGLSTATDMYIGNLQSVVTSKTGTEVNGMVLPANVTGSVKVKLADGTLVTAKGKFTITETGYPTAQQGGKLVDTVKYHYFVDDYSRGQGSSVAVSADGNTAIVGVPKAAQIAGGVLIYIRQNGHWVLARPLFQTNSGLGVGISVAISADGSTAVVGTLYQSPGYVTVVKKVNGSWSNPAVEYLSSQSPPVLSGSAPDPYSTASSVSITADGKTILLGSARPLSSQYSGGADTVKIYSDSGNGWVQTKSPVIDDTKPEVGSSVAISADGKTVALVSQGHRGGRNTPGIPGYTVIFKRSSSTSDDWTLQKTLGQYPFVSLSADGNTFLGGYTAATDVYTRTGTKWALVQTINEAGQAALSADGKTIVMANNATVYTKEGATYTQKTALKAGYGAFTASLSADGTTAFIGNPNDNTTTEYHEGYWDPSANFMGNIGAVYAFTSQAGVGSFSPASGPVGTLVTVDFTNIPSPTSVKIGGKEALIISKTANTVTAMVMPGAVTGAVTVGGISAGDNFTVNVTPFPNIQTSAKMADTSKYASGAKSTHSLLQGTALAISADGNTAVAASGKSTYSATTYSGQNVIFYAKVNGSWKQSRFVNTSYTNWSYPLKAAINADGTTALVVFADGPNSINPGFVYGYHKNANGEWEADAQGIPGVLGLAIDVAISADGNTAVTGYKKCTAHGCETHAEVFYRVNGVWAGQQDPGLPGSQPDAKYYVSGAGAAVTISADGKTIATANTNSGPRIYIYNGTAWVLQQALSVASGAPLLSADGNILIAGSRICTRVNNKWVYTQTLSTTGAPAISADANTVIFTGAKGPVVYARSNDAAGWVKQNTSFAAGSQALSVALSADGKSGFASNPQDTTVFASQKYYDQDNNLVGTFPIGAVYGLGTGTPVIAPTALATNIDFIPQTPDSIYFRFTNGSGSARAIFIKEGSTGFPTIVDGVTYTANAKFGQGTPAGAGWYCIYNGPHTRTDAPPLMAGLKASTPYIIAILEYNGKYGAEKYATTGTIGKTTTFDLNIRSSNLVFTNTTGTSTTLSWTNGSGVGRMVFVSTTPYDSGAGPLDTYYSPNTKYGSGNQVNGYYCVYNGTGNSVNITGLTGGQRYRAIVYDYNGSIESPKMIRVYEVSESAANMVTPVEAPTGYATGLAFNNTAATSTTLSWVSSNGAARAVFLKLGTSGALNVVQGTTYTGNSSFGTGSAVGTNGWYCVYNGTGSSVNLTGLSASSTYRAIVIEYNGSAGTEAYNLSRYNAANVTTTAAPAMLLTTSQKRMLVEQDALDDTNVEVNVHQALSPNGDGVNDVFTIDGIGAYPENTVKVINSNGDVIYSAAGYNNYSNAFDGHAANGTLQQAGTYFYTMEYKKGKETVRKTGYLVLKY